MKESKCQTGSISLNEYIPPLDIASFYSEYKELENMRVICLLKANIRARMPHSACKYRDV